MKSFLVALLLAFLFAIFVGSADAQLPPGSIMTTGTAHSHSVSRPLGEMTTCPREIGPVLPDPKREPAGNFLSDPIVSFDGLHLGELVGGHCSFRDVATDDSGAVGFDHYVQVVNTAIAVYDKSGNMLAGPVSCTTFWENQPDCGQICGTDSVVHGSTVMPIDGSSVFRAGD